MVSPTLSAGACLRLRKNPDGDSAQEPFTMKVIKVEAIQNGKKLKVMLSDGQNEVLGVVTSSVAEQAGKIEASAVLQISSALTNHANGKFYLLIKEAKVISAGNAKDAMDVEVKAEAPAPKAAAPGTPRPPAPSQGSSTASPAVVPLLKPAAMINARLVPIARLNPYMNKWTIKARVTTKGEVRKWNNSRGPGQLFSVSLLDAQGTEIRATFFNSDFFDALEQDKIYTFGNGRVKVANRTYTSIKHQYEVSFGADAVVHQCEDDANIKKMSFSFLPIGKLLETEAGRTVDIMGVIHSQMGLQSITSKKGNELQKRDLILVDSSQKSIRCTLWGGQASKPDSDFADFAIIAIKGCKLSDYGGRSLSTYQSSTVVINPEDVAGTEELREWYDTEVVANSVVITPISEAQQTGGKVKDRKLLTDIAEEGLGFGDKADWMNVKATVCIVRPTKKDGSGPWYAACPEEGNNKKVIQNPDGTWLCEATQKTYPAPEYRYILPAKIIDSAGIHWVTLFNEQAKMFLGGKSADDMYALKDSDHKAYEKLMDDSLWQEVDMRLRIKADTYNDEKRLRVVVSRFRKINYAEETKYLLGEIQKMM